MRLARAITLAATITALSALAPPAHAGGGASSLIITSISAFDCETNEGSVVDDSASSTGRRCQGGEADGLEIIG